MLLGIFRCCTAIILIAWGDYALASISLYTRKVAPPVIGIDVAVIVDLSNTPEKTVLSRLRTAQALLGRLAMQDRAMIVGYAKKGIYYSDLLALAQPQQKDSLFELLRELPRDAPFPLLTKALDQTISTLDKHRDKSRKRMVVLISEGRTESDDPLKSFTKLQTLMDKTVPRLQKAGIRLYAVSHTENANLPMLKVLTRENRGELFQADEHQARSREFFQRILADNRFVVTKKRAEQWFDIKQDYPDLVIIASKQTPDALISLYPPNNEHWRQANLPHQYRWITTEKYDLIALHHPEHGAWRIEYSTVLGHIRFITAMSLRHNISTSTFPSGIDFQFEASLLGEDAKPLPEELLEYFVVQVALQPQGKSVSQVLAKQDPAAAHQYRAQVHLAPAGPLALQIVAESPFATLVDTMNLTISTGIFPQVPAVSTAPRGDAQGEAKNPQDIAHAREGKTQDPSTHTSEQKVTHKMLDALEWINEKLAPVVEQAKQYAENELAPRAQEKSRDALDWADKQSKDVIDQGKRYLAQTGEQPATEIPPNTSLMTLLLQHPQAKIWGGSAAGVLFALWLWRRMRRKKRDAVDDNLNDDMDSDDVDTADIKISAAEDTPVSTDETPVVAAEAEQRSDGAEIPLDRPPDATTTDGLAQLEQAAAEKTAA